MTNSFPWGYTYHTTGLIDEPDNYHNYLWNRLLQHFSFGNRKTKKERIFTRSVMGPNLFD